MRRDCVSTAPRDIPDGKCWSPFSPAGTRLWAFGSVKAAWTSMGSAAFARIRSPNEGSPSSSASTSSLAALRSCCPSTSSMFTSSSSFVSPCSTPSEFSFFPSNNPVGALSSSSSSDSVSSSALDILMTSGCSSAIDTSSASPPLATTV